MGKEPRPHHRPRSPLAAQTEVLTEPSLAVSKKGCWGQRVLGSGRCETRSLRFHVTQVEGGTATATATVSVCLCTPRPTATPSTLGSTRPPPRGQGHLVLGQPLRHLWLRSPRTPQCLPRRRPPRCLGHVRGISYWGAVPVEPLSPSVKQGPEDGPLARGTGAEEDSVHSMTRVPQTSQTPLLDSHPCGHMLANPDTLGPTVTMSSGFDFGSDLGLWPGPRVSALFGMFCATCQAISILQASVSLTCSMRGGQDPGVPFLLQVNPPGAPSFRGLPHECTCRRCSARLRAGLAALGKQSNQTHLRAPPLEKLDQLVSLFSRLIVLCLMGSAELPTPSGRPGVVFPARKVRQTRAGGQRSGSHWGRGGEGGKGREAQAGPAALHGARGAILQRGAWSDAPHTPTHAHLPAVRDAECDFI